MRQRATHGLRLSKTISFVNSIELSRAISTRLGSKWLQERYNMSDLIEASQYTNKANSDAFVYVMFVESQFINRANSDAFVCVMFVEMLLQPLTPGLELADFVKQC